MQKIVLILVSALVGLAAVFGLTRTLALNIDNQSPVATAVTITDLGTLGGSESHAAGINNLGQVVGRSTLSGSIEFQAFSWVEGVMEPLERPTGTMAAMAYAVNDRGLIVGEIISPAGGLTTTTPMLWANNVFTPLTTLNSVSSTTGDINNADLIIGNTLSETDNALLLWQGELLSATAVFSQPLGQVTALNNFAQVVGYQGDVSGTKTAFLWQDDLFTPLLPLSGTLSMAWDINDNEQIVGSTAISNDLTSHAFIWQSGVMTDLGTLAAGPPSPTATSVARAINSAGVIVGESTVAEQTRAVLWEDGQIVDLNALLPLESFWTLISANDINEAGWIVGDGLIDGELHGFLLQRPLLTYQSHLPIILYDHSSPFYDMGEFMGGGDGRLYEVQHSNGSRARHQTQVTPSRFYHTKGNEVKAEWEELWSSSQHIYRGTDTSPGNNQYYTLFENNSAGSTWSPRYWQVGDVYERNPLVVFYRKSDCQIVNSGMHLTWLRFEAYHPTFTFQSGITLPNVVQLSWLLTPDGDAYESYFYAAGYGLVGWGSADRGYSYIDEIHAPGLRPDNKREVIPCLNSEQTVQELLRRNPDLNLGPLPDEYRFKVK